MAVLQMKKITICALLTDRKQVLDFLQGAGVVEISRLEEPEESDFRDRIRLPGGRAARGTHGRRNRPWRFLTSMLRKRPLFFQGLRESPWLPEKNLQLFRKTAG